MLSCASAAIAVAALAPRPAHAQVAAPLGAFRGSITSQVGTVTRNQTSNTTETITIGSNTATINWSPTDTAIGGGPINFLPTGNVATYTSSPGVTFYTVLNRIVPTDPSRSILLDGSVISTLEGTSTVGGNVWFYSPGGIIIGSNAMFDVGGLLLTTADLPNGFTADGNGFSASFSAPSDSLSAVQIMPGAEINALQQNSYVAVVAPRVEQGGTVKVDGSAAYVAATSLTMTMNQGLFDIQIDLGGGSDDTQGVVHTGSTTGGDTASQSNNHKVYLVAVPKNNAMTMLLGGTAGFDANVAGYENGQIVLSGGYNLNDAAGDLQRGYLSDITQPGGVQIDPGTYLSDVQAFSNGSIEVGANSGNIDFKGDVSLNSFDAWDDGTVSVEAFNGNSINVAGDLSMHSENPLFQGGTQVKLLADPGSSILVGGNLNMSAQFYPGYGGTAQIDAFGGSIAIGGLTTVNVDGIDNPDIPYGDQRRGGTIDISSTDSGADQGSITTNGMILTANGVGHDNAGIEDSQLVDATGGFIDVNTSDGGEILVNGNFSAVASAFGGQQSTGGFTGGQGQGGEVRVGTAGGTFHITGAATLNADATGGDGAAGINGGAAFGGIADFYSVGPGTLQIDGNVITSATGAGGNGQNGGFGQGGHAGIFSSDGSVLLGGNAFVSSQGFGGNASFGFGGTGGSAQGGVGFIEADSSEGGTSGSITGTTATITSDATGGMGGAGDGQSIAAGAGGSAAGGLYEGFDTGGAYALADINGATLSLTSVTVSSSATGGAGGTGGAGQSGGIGGSAIGGTAQAGTWNPTATTDLTGSAGFADIFVAATGRGGNGGGGGAGDGNGGIGTGGGAIFAADGDTSATYVNLNANGTGGNGADGGTGFGGSGSAGGVLLQSAQNANMVITGGVDMYAIGQGGFA
jgi:filamentous hemagglutinin family protein